ncbi:hypothetical protein PCYB_061730 [Plasmodium cynomolgi strain B]|uniref:Uncharacterized protein n=1 Tax=Plasmodium cynomolgi (strain B) TaxID=1120755 RepID=K6UCU1_PLACD|nr:hypothetical protein PCYB_061730 [Plasmodium cynomolgi strain B]GAB65441.1 hypothetical protein PCYB_061730 [Plasmodium cynomolgi strain B]
MEEDNAKQTLFSKKHKQRNRFECQFCWSKNRTCANMHLTWEVALLVVHILIFPILIFKLVMDGKLEHKEKTLFRSFESGGHFMQGIVFILLIVPFKFNKMIINWIYNLAMKNETCMDECTQHPYHLTYQQLHQQPGDNMEESKKGNSLSNKEGDDAGVSEKGNERDSSMNTARGSFDDDNIDQQEVGDRTTKNQVVKNQKVNNKTVNSQAVAEHFADASKMDTGKRDGHAEFIHIGYANSDSVGNNIDHQNGNAGKNTSGEHLTTNMQRTGINGRPPCENTDSNIPLCESFVNSLVFPPNTPNHSREKIQCFFMCAKLYANKKSAFLFFLKYFFTVSLMFTYPLYNLWKRKRRYKNFYCSSYFSNAFDFASGLLMGSFFVLSYGLMNFFDNLYKNRKKEKFQFFDNYPFLREMKCICDENARLILYNNPHLRKIGIQYLKSYRTYKKFLFKGFFVLFFASMKGLTECQSLETTGALKR